MKALRNWRSSGFGLAAVGLWLATGVVASWAAVYTWDGNGGSDNSGNWSTVANWNPDGAPGTSDDVTLSNVSAGTRTVTFDASAVGARTLTITQTTVGPTVINRLVLAKSWAASWATNGLGLTLNPAGNFVLDKGGYDFKPYWGDHSNPPLATWGPNTKLNSTGGSIGDQWDSPRTRFNFQGQVNLSGGNTNIAAGTGVTIDTGGVLNLTSNGGLDNGDVAQAGQPAVYGFTLVGTLNGNSTGLIRSVKVTLDPTAQVPTGPATISTNALVIKSSTPANIDLSSTTLRRVKNNIIGEYEVASSAGGAGTNFKIGTVYTTNYNGTRDSVRTRLVNNYANSGNQANEYMLVNTFDASSAWQEDFDLNGQKLVIDNGPAGYKGAGGLFLTNRSAGHGVIQFLTTGGALNMNNTGIGLSNGGIMEIIGPASISNFYVYDTGTAVGNNGGSFKFTGNMNGSTSADSSVTTAGSSITLDLGSTANTWTNNRALTVSNSSTFTVIGSVINASGDMTGPGGLFAVGRSKTGATGTPTITPAGNITIAGNYSVGGTGGRLNVGRQATLKMGGNFDSIWWNGLGGNGARSFYADTSPSEAATVIFNGGAVSVQTMEILSRDYAVVTDLATFAAAGTAVGVGQTVTGATSGATGTVAVINTDTLQLTGVSGTFTPDETLNYSGGGTARAYASQYSGLDAQTSGSIAHLPFGTLSIGEQSGSPASVKLVNSGSPWGPVETTQVARNLNVTTGSTLDLNGYGMTVAIGNANVQGQVTDSYGVGRTSTLLLAENAGLTVNGGTVAVDQLTLNAGSNLSLLGGASLSNTAFTLAGTNIVTNTSGANTIAGPVTLNGGVTLNAAAGTLNLTGSIGGAGGSVTKNGSGVAAYGGAASYGGTTAINGGVLRVNGSYSGGAITVNSGGTLGGGGTISSAINMAGGTINPGASPGTLTVNNATVNFGSGGTLAMEIAGLAGGQYDVLNFTGTGALNLSGTNDVLDLYILSPYYSQIGDTLTLVTSSTAISGGFETLRLFGGNWPGAYTVSYPGGNTAQIQFLISIPEPASLTLLALGGLVGLRRRRRA